MAYQKAHPEQRRATVAAYRKAHPEQLLAAARAGTARLQKEGYFRAWAKAHPEAAAAAHARRRAWMKVGDLTPKQILALQEASQGICPYCGRPFTEGELDHMVCRVRGGVNTISNVVWCCAPCNQEKNAKALGPWLKQHPGSAKRCRQQQAKARKLLHHYITA